MNGEIYGTDGSLALKCQPVGVGPLGDLYPEEEDISQFQGKVGDNVVRALDFLNRLASNYRSRSSQEDGLKSRLEAPIVVSVKLTKDTQRSEHDLVERTRRSIDRAHEQWRSDRMLQRLYPHVGEGHAYMGNGNVIYRVLSREEPGREHGAEAVAEPVERAGKKRALKKISYM